MLKEYFIPDSATVASGIKKRYGDTAFFLSGGTELNSRTDIQPEYLISLEKLAINGFCLSDGEVSIGANTTFQEILDGAKSYDSSRKTLDALFVAAGNLASINIRNIATIGGNIASNRSCSDVIPTLMAYHARLKLVNLDGEKHEMSLSDYIKSPVSDLITTVVFDIPADNFRIKSRRHSRSANDLAIINIAISCSIQDQKFYSPVIAVGGVAKHVVRLLEVEKKLDGMGVGDLDYKQLEKWVTEDIQPIDDIRGTGDFKKYLCKVMVSDVLQELCQD